MRKTETALYGVFNRARSWIPQMAEASTVSRDFWMPDQSCRVCYDCESQFTIFNRRHHCRICGRVFCGRCTVNTIHASVVDGSKYDQEEGERIRVCSFCFKKREEPMAASQYDDTQLLSPGISPSPSVTSLGSSKSSGSDSGVNVFGAMPYSTVAYQHVAYSSALSNPAQGADGLEPMPDKKQDIPYSGRNTNSASVPGGGGSAASIFGTPPNRSDDEDDEYGKILEDPEWHISRQTEEYFQDNCNLVHDPGYNFNEIHPVGYSSQNSMYPGSLETETSSKAKNSDKHADGMYLLSQTGIQEDSKLSRVPERSGEESEGTDNADECNEASMFNTPGPDFEQSVDIEKILDIWIPPEPEDEQDEKETGVFDDEDDDDDGGWGLPRSTGSFSDSEYKSKERSSEEYRKAMRSVVDGHFRALVAQLLKGEDVPVGEENHRESWLEIVTSLSWQAASLVKPDTSKGGGMDPGGYVKVKCIACRCPSESEVIKGVACKKNVAHRRMTPKYKNARLLLLGGALEYQRVSNQLSSLDTLLQQEMEHLKMTVTKIEAHHPNVLLVEKTVSRYAQEYLLAKEISLVLNVKRPLLERIARCTGAQIVPSVDNLTAPKLGHCEFFHVEKFVEEHGSAGQAGKKLQKTLMFFDGCPKPLGCTVLLKGANGDELKKVKRVVQYAIFAAYHLALETSFLADEGATLPELPLKSPITVALPDKQSSLDRSISMIPGFVTPASGQVHTGDVQSQKVPKNNILGTCNLPCNLPNLNKGETQSPVNSEGLIERGPQPLVNTTTGIAGPAQLAIGSNPSSANVVLIYDTGVKQQEINSAPQNSFPPAAPLGHLVSGLSSPTNEVLEATGNGVDSSSYEAGSCYFGFEDKKLDGIGKDDGPILSVVSGSPLENQMSVEEKPHELQWENKEKNDDQVNPNLILDQKVTRCETQDTVHCEEQGLSREDFPPSPSDQQSILVSLSTRCVWKGTICERAHLFRIKYYGISDKPLGRFLRDDLFDQGYRCRSCDAPTEAHVHCYTHKQGSLTISVKRLAETILPGEKEGKIWMWHLCLKCASKCKAPQPTRRVVMSDAAWGLSFGKFLELSFSNHAAASRVASCGHSLHRDCLRFYGFGRMVACFRYASIHVYSVHLPPPKLEFNDPNQNDWLTKEAAAVADGAELFFAEAFDSLRQIGEKIASSGSFYAGIKVPESRRRIAELEGMLQKEKTEFEDLLKKVSTKDWQPEQPVADILELNRLRRQIIFESYLWDHRLRYLDSSLRVKRSIAGSDSCLAEELNPHMQKNIDSNLSVKVVESKRTEKYDSDASKVVNSRVESNGSQLDGSFRDSSSSLSSLQFENVPINNTQVIGDGVIWASSKLESSQDPLLPDHLTSIDDMGERFGGVGKTTEWVEKQRPPLVEHMETSVNNSITVSSTVEKLLTDPDLCKHVNRNDANGILPETKFVETVDIDDKTEVVEGDLGVRRSLSDGNFPILANLSETLDAAWTGEGQSVVAQAVHVTSQGQEIGPAAPAIQNIKGDLYLSTKSSSLPAQTSVIPPAVKTEATDSNYNMQDKNGSEQLQVSTPVSPVKSFDVSEEFGNWIGSPFSNLCKTYSKGLQGFLSGSSLKFDSLSGYIPTFVSSLSQLGGQGEAKLLLPTGVNDTVIAIYDDEPTSIIAYALTSHEYYAHVSDKTADKSKQREKDRDKEKETGDSSFMDEALSHPLQTLDGSDVSEGIPKEKSYGSDDSFTSGSKWTGVADPFLYTKAMHVKVSFSDESSPGKVKYNVTCYYAKQFDALRRKCCPTEMDFIRSLCRCRKWGAQGGKSNVFFAKTLDDRFIIKQVTKTELESFIKFAPEYFKYLSDSLSTGSPTCLAKVLGIYQVTTKNAKGGKEVRMDLMAMENLLFGRNITRLYDLKGSNRSRYNADSSGSNKVLLDQNLLESMPTSPIFVGNKAKRLLERAVWNDTSFLASIDVMDYSLLVGVDEERHELVLGIIDFMRQYTWDKHLETWVKASGILGGPKNTSPTVISPMQYKKRFRKAMSTYFLMVPDQWTPPTIIPSYSQNQLCEDPMPMSAQGDVGE